MSDRCSTCKDEGAVCENHPFLPWESGTITDCQCGGAGIPCPKCCSPVDPGGSAIEAFMPDWKRVA